MKNTNGLEIREETLFLFGARVSFERKSSTLNESTNLWMQIFSSSILDDFAPTKQLAP